MRSPLGEHHAAHLRPSLDVSMSSTRLWKRISPPSASMVARMFSTMLTSRKVPMCGLLDVQDFCRRAGLDEFGQHLAAVDAAGP